MTPQKTLRASTVLAAVRYLSRRRKLRATAAVWIYYDDGRLDPVVLKPFIVLPFTAVSMRERILKKLFDAGYIDHFSKCFAGFCCMSADVGTKAEFDRLPDSLRHTRQI